MRVRVEKTHLYVNTCMNTYMIKSIRLRMTGKVARMDEGKSVFKMLTDEPTG